MNKNKNITFFSIFNGEEKKKNVHLLSTKYKYFLSATRPITTWISLRYISSQP